MKLVMLKKIRLYISSKKDWIIYQCNGALLPTVFWNMQREQKHARVNFMMYVIWEGLLTELFFNLDVGVIHVLPPPLNFMPGISSLCGMSWARDRQFLCAMYPFNCTSLRFFVFLAVFCVCLLPRQFLVSEHFYVWNLMFYMLHEAFLPGPLFLYFLYSLTVRCEEMLHLPHILN